MSTSFNFFLQGKALKEIHAILIETLREHTPSYTTVKNWVAQFKRGDFPTCVSPRPGRPKTMTTPEIMLTHMWQEIEYRIDVCRVTRDAHIEYL